MGVSEASQDFPSSGLSLPKPPPSKANISSSLEPDEKEALLNDPIGSPSRENSETDESSTPCPESKSTSHEDVDEDVVASNAKSDPEANSKTEMANLTPKKKPKVAARARRACSASVNYKIGSSDSESEEESEEEEDVEDDDEYQEDDQEENDSEDDDFIVDDCDEDGDYKNDVSEEDDDEEDGDIGVLESESVISEVSTTKKVAVENHTVENENEKDKDGDSPTKKVIVKEENDEGIAAPIEKKKKNTKAKVKEAKKAISSSLGEKRKKATKAIKTEAPIKNEEGPPKKKAKKPRVSEAVVEDAADKMLKVLIEKYKDGIKEVPLDELAGSITNKKGKAYTNHRSDAIVEGLKRLASLNQAEKTKGVARLTQAEIDKIPQEEISSDPAKVLEQRLQQFLDRLSRHKKGGSGAKIVTAAKAVWDKLLDGKAYSSKQLVAVTEYSGTNSSGFEAIMVTLKKSNFVETSGGSKYAFTDKVFPHGRP